MTESERLLAVCRTCMNSLNSVLGAGLPNNTELQIRQNLFMLEAAMQDFSVIPPADKDREKDTPLPPDLKKASMEFEKKIILRAIEFYGSKRKAAKALNLDHSTLIKKCQRYGI